tara:strand:+ start:3638 stop:4189 length:552 start_codon:yes stop_codon:yes gene_type:complete
MWWNILKRQVASTRGKQFQLDFNQPMIEEEEDNCKKRLINILNKLETFILNKKGSIKHTVYKYVRVFQVSKPGNLEDISNEDCCKILDILGANGPDAKIKTEQEAEMLGRNTYNYNFKNSFVQKRDYFEKDMIQSYVSIVLNKGQGYELQYEHLIAMGEDSPERQKLLDEIFDYGIYRIYDEG